MRTSLMIGGLALFLLARLAGGAPVEPFEDKKGYRDATLDPFSSLRFTLKCKARERTCAIIYGLGKSPMGVYVFDPHGNCVARDDVAPTLISDDLATEWHPATEETYVIEVHNLGRKNNNAEIAIR
jgi:hypothetical protein